jgi:hypothetical protein
MSAILASAWHRGRQRRYCGSDGIGVEGRHLYRKSKNDCQRKTRQLRLDGFAVVVISKQRKTYLTPHPSHIQATSKYANGKTKTRKPNQPQVDKWQGSGFEVSSIMFEKIIEQLTLKSLRKICYLKPIVFSKKAKSLIPRILSQPYQTRC